MSATAGSLPEPKPQSYTFSVDVEWYGEDDDDRVPTEDELAQIVADHCQSQGLEARVTVT